MAPDNDDGNPPNVQALLTSALNLIEDNVVVRDHITKAMKTVTNKRQLDPLCKIVNNFMFYTRLLILFLFLLLLIYFTAPITVCYAHLFAKPTRKKTKYKRKRLDRPGVPF